MLNGLKNYGGSITIIKGILDVDDAVKASNIRAEGIIVSIMVEDN